MGKRIPRLRREPIRITGEAPCKECPVVVGCGCGMCKEWQVWFCAEWDALCKRHRIKWGVEKDADE